MSDYTPTLEDAKRTYAYIQGGLDHDEGYKPFYQVHEEAFDRMIAEVERAAAARAVQRVRNEIRGIPHWWNTEDQRGGFDIPPLGPNASSEEGAFMEVMRVLDECAAEYRKEQ